MGDKPLSEIEPGETPKRKNADMTKLEFFSGSEALGNEDGAHGYDGSMSVEAFNPADLAEHIRRMDCVCGPVLVVATDANGRKSAWPCVRAD